MKDSSAQRSQNPCLSASAASRRDCSASLSCNLKIFQQVFDWMSSVNREKRFIDRNS